MSRMLLSGVVAAAACLFAGCGEKQAAAVPDEKQTALTEVYNLIRVRVESDNSPPRKAEDLRIYENAHPQGYAVVKSGEVVVNWGAGPADSSAVLAYQKEVPSSGGWVLLQNGKVKQMTADEFKAAPKAK